MVSRQLKTICLILGLLSICLNSWADSVSDADRPLMIRNVTLIDTQGIKKDVVANLLIMNYKLAIVSKGDLPVNDDTRIIDAKKGFLMGSLVMGERVTFLVFSEDPRENKYIILDTKNTAKIAVYESVLIDSRYPMIDPANISDEEKKVKRGWLAYTPPPVSLATSYQDGRAWNTWRSKWVNGVVIGALAVDRQNWQQQDSNSLAQVGDVTDSNTAEVRALRFGVAGTINFDSPWVYNLAGATNAFSKGFDEDETDDLTWFDWRLDIPMPAKTTLSIGKQKEPMSMERTIGMVFQSMQERSAAADAMMPGRNVGLVYSGTAAADNMSWAFGVFNDAWDDDGDFSDNSNQVVGRLTVVPYESTSGSELLHLGAGWRYSDGKEGYHFFSEPEFNLSPRFVDTGLQTSENFHTVQLESALKLGDVWLSGEYMKTLVDSEETGNPEFGGYHVNASWVLTGESRAYNRRNGTFKPVPVAQTVHQGGIGAWEISTRFSNVDLTDGFIDGGDMDIFSVGVNWWLTPLFSIGMNARHIWLDKSDMTGEASGFNTRILLIM